ncbi:hypothetical protein MPSEU_000688300 [Mayamaea pseudoterrestris]|nr:hypothetical protein MPSEU_000688300 [Mayamaea pseudoterrestris]
MTVAKVAQRNAQRLLSCLNHGRHSSSSLSACSSAFENCYDDERPSVRTLATYSVPSARRKRPNFESLKVMDTKSNSFGRLEEPYQHGQANMQDYLKKTSLSPWVPLSDAASRKIFDLANVNAATTIHVDLGSGDGRVCFNAIDYGVQKSTGIDVDQDIVQVANERLHKRHPLPPLQFVVADLMDAKQHETWKLIQEANLITMYFAKEALQVFRPLLEQKLVGRKCKIVTCGYEMPEWTYTQFEVVLGTQLYLYEWGGSLMNKNDDDEYNDLPFIDSILANRPRELETEAVDNERFQGSKVIDRTNIIPGFDPRVLDEMDELEDDDWDAEDDSIEDEGAKDSIGNDGKHKTEK